MYPNFELLVIARPHPLRAEHGHHHSVLHIHAGVNHLMTGPSVKVFDLEPESVT